MDSIEVFLDQDHPDLSNGSSSEDLAALRLVMRNPASSTIFDILDQCEDLADD
ncbi:MAG: hypothetical protein U0451_02335 [Candidatus Saccharimonadales bacterium]